MSLIMRLNTPLLVIQGSLMVPIAVTPLYLVMPVIKIGVNRLLVKIKINRLPIM